MVVPFWSGRRDNRPVCPDCSIRRCVARAKRPYQVESQVPPSLRACREGTLGRSRGEMAVRDGDAAPPPWAGGIRGSPGKDNC